MRIATACSGTDGPILVWDAFSKALSRELKISLVVMPTFSCEKVPAKQQFIRAAFDVPLLFNDARELGSQVGFDVVSQNLQPIPDNVNVCLAGWPCTDISGMNVNYGKQRNRSCVSQGGLRTGTGFRGVLEFCSKHGGELDFLISENVPALTRPNKEGVDNLTAAVQLLRKECDMITKVWSLNPMLHFGVPQSRERLWFPSFRIDLLQSLHLSEQDADQLLSETMNTIVGCRTSHISSYILPEDSEFVQHFIRELGSSRNLEECSVSTQAKWPRIHLERFRKHRVSWWDCRYPDQLTMYTHPALKSFTLREYDILHFNGIREYPEKALRLIETSQSIGRSSSLEDHVGTLTPKLRFYISTRCRPLLGVECLRLQSLFFPGHEQGQFLLDFSDATLRDLAGNAFEGSCCAAVVFSCCVLLATGAAQEERSTSLGDLSSSLSESDFEGVWE